MKLREKAAWRMVPELSSRGRAFEPRWKETLLINVSIQYLAQSENDLIKSRVMPWADGSSRGEQRHTGAPESTTKFAREAVTPRVLINEAIVPIVAARLSCLTISSAFLLFTPASHLCISRLNVKRTAATNAIALPLFFRVALVRNWHRIALPIQPLDSLFADVLLAFVYSMSPIVSF